MDDGNAIAKLPTRTERRAMDWSLVLASQGISATIENDPESGWALVVSSAEYEPAKAAIAQYRRENMSWWQQPVTTSGVVFDWMSALWVLLTWVFYQLQVTLPRFQDAGVVENAAVARGEWWRLFTAELLHADRLHLASNSVFGLLLIGLAMGRLGTGIAMLGAVLAGAAGNYLSLLLHPEAHQALGASGVVMGALGLLAAPSWLSIRHERRGWKIAFGSVAVGAMLFALVGLHPGTDVVAHFGGFVTGVIIGAILSPFHELPRKPKANLTAAAITAAIISCTWSLALRTVR